MKRLLPIFLILSLRGSEPSPSPFKKYCAWRVPTYCREERSEDFVVPLMEQKVRSYYRYDPISGIGRLDEKAFIDLYYSVLDLIERGPCLSDTRRAINFFSSFSVKGLLTLREKYLFINLKGNI